MKTVLWLLQFSNWILLVFFSSFLSIGNEETSITLIFTISLDSNILSSVHDMAWFNYFRSPIFRTFCCPFFQWVFQSDREKNEHIHFWLVQISMFGIGNWWNHFVKSLCDVKRYVGEISYVHYGSSSVFLNPLVGKIVLLGAKYTSILDYHFKCFSPTLLVYLALLFLIFHPSQLANFPLYLFIWS